MRFGLEKLEYPIVLSPMLGVVTPEMVAEVSNQGGLGHLPLGGQSVQQAISLIRKTKKLTQQVFAVNLFANKPVDLDLNRDKISKMKSLITQIVKEKGWAETYQFDYHFYPYQALIEVLIEEQIKVVSFTFGVLDDESIRRLKTHDVYLIGTATNVQEAELLESAGVDAIIAQGIEAGGHRASFLGGDLPQIGVFPLVTFFGQNVKVPIIAAGGIYHAKTVTKALDCGAKGVQLGSYFIAAEESLATDFYRRLLKNSKDQTILTQAFSGRWARGIKNDFSIMTESMDIPDYPIQNVLTKQLRTLAKAHQDENFSSNWGGVNAYHSEKKPVRVLMKELIEIYLSVKKSSENSD